jgi:anti-anti-sigma factor
MRLAEVDLNDEGRVVVARLSGEIDLSNTASIGGALAEQVPNSAHGLVLDLTDIDFLDSAGIHLIYELREKLRIRGQAMQLVIPRGSPVNDALRLAGVSGHVATAYTVQSALSRLR